MKRKPKILVKKEEGICYKPSIQSYSAVFIITTLVYVRSIDAEFVYDDRQAILSNQDVVGDDPWLLDVFSHDFWGNPMSNRGSHKSFRPLTTLTFRAGRLLHGLQPQLFHAVNVFLHAATSCLVLMMMSKFLGKVGSLSSATIFAVHAANTEAVCSIVGRADILATATVILGFLDFQRNEGTRLTPVFAIVALFFKETGIVLLPLIGLHIVLMTLANRKSARKLLEISVQFVSLCYFRLFINGFQSPRFSASDNPIAHEPSWKTRTMTFLYLPMAHLSTLLFPNTLSFDWSMDSIPLIKNPMDQRFLSTLIAYTSIIAFTINFVIKSNIIGKFSNFSQFSTDSEKIDVKSQKALFFIGWMILSHLPSSNLFFNVGFVLAERILYMTNVGFCGFVGLGLQVLLDRKPAYKSCIISIFSIVLILHSVRTWRRTDDWKNEENLFSSAISINPPKAFANLGHVYAARGESKKASEVYELALNYRPNMADTWYNLGILKNDNGDKSGASKCYQNALTYRKTFAAAMLNLALVEWDLGLEPTALARLEVCQSINGEDGKFYRHHQVTLTHCGFNKGRLLASKGKHSEAAEAYEKALKNAPKGYENAAALLNSLGETYAKLGDDLQAERCFQKALEANPKHVNAYITLAHLRIRQNRSTEASSWLSKARSLAPESPTVLQQAAQAAFVIGNLNNSETLFREALRLDRTHAESLHGLANVLRELGRNEESEEVLARLCEVRPDDPVAVANYAATLHLNEKHDHALKMYDRALRLNPADRTTAENRAKLLRTMRRNTLL